jgi:hypothetical protein
VAAVLAGWQAKLYLGNLEARPDWGYAPEYVAGMWRMLQQEAPADLGFGTGETRSVRELAEEAFGYVDLDWRVYVAVDPRYFRPTEVEQLRADPSEAERRLGWEVRIRFRDLVRIMVGADLEAAGLPAPGLGTRRVAEEPSPRSSASALRPSSAANLRSPAGETVRRRESFSMSRTAPRRSYSPRSATMARTRWTSARGSRSTSWPWWNSSPS